MKLLSIGSDHDGINLWVDGEGDRGRVIVPHDEAVSVARQILSATENYVAHTQWCPVCKTHHLGVGEATDAGVITRACPNLPTDDPRYYGSPVYTGDRG